MARVRDAILSAVAEADRLHQRFDTKARANRERAGSTCSRCWWTGTSP